MVGHIPLEDGIGVRVPVPQPVRKNRSCVSGFSVRAGEQGLEGRSDVSLASETARGGLRTF